MLLTSHVPTPFTVEEWRLVLSDNCQYAVDAMRLCIEADKHHKEPEISAFVFFPAPQPEIKPLPLNGRPVVSCDGVA